MSRRMAQRHEHLTRTALLVAHVIFDDGVTAVESTFITEPFKDALGRMSLFARARLIFRQPLINLIDIGIQLWPFDLRRPPIPRRFRIRQHLRNAVPADPKIPSNLPPAQPILKMSPAHLQIQVHGEYPQALPKTERAKVDDFYAAPRQKTGSRSGVAHGKISEFCVRARG